MPIFGCCASRRYVQRISAAGSMPPLGTRNGIGLYSLEDELGLGRGVTADLAEAVRVNAAASRHFQRQQLQRHHVDDWSQSFIDRRRFRGKRGFETPARVTERQGRRTDLVDGRRNLGGP